MKNKKIFIYFIINLFILSLLTTGCGKKNMPTFPTEVKTMKVIQQDVPIEHEYVGQIVATHEVAVQSKISGNVIAKYVQGGEYVRKGQPLFKIDGRTYQAAVLSQQAVVAQQAATLKNAEKDAKRYKNLAKQNAISKQTSDNQNSVVIQQAAALRSQKNVLKQANINLHDTVIYAPVSGKIDLKDIGTGNYATQGNTVLATISTLDPVYVQFSISENEYLNLFKEGKKDLTKLGQKLSLYLSNGSLYNGQGKITQIDRSLENNTGSLSIKALFANHNRELIPGMFAKIKIQSAILKNALLIPQRAVQSVLEKNFVTVLGKDNKSQPKLVVLGDKINNLYVVKSGLNSNDIIIVEGFSKLQPGVLLKPKMIQLKDLLTNKGE